jgi:hypothetical protein
MIQNLTSGRIYKGSNTEITVPVYPCCFSGAEVQDMLVSFYTDPEGYAINFSQAEGMEIVDGNITVILTAVGLESLEDGQLKYHVECSAFDQDFETRFWIKTPEHQAPELDYITRGEAQDMIDESIEGKQDELVSGENIKTINGESILGEGDIEIQGGGGAGNVYAAIRRVTDYAYDIDYLGVDYDYAKEYFLQHAPFNSAGCSAIAVGTLVGRNLDWHYDNVANFVVHTPGVVGVAGGLNALTKDMVDSGDYNEAYKILPFYLQDGYNSSKLFAEMNVVPAVGCNVTVPTIEKRDSICAIMLVRYILDNFTSVDAAVDYLQKYVEIYNPTTLIDMGYELHFLLRDNTKAEVIEFVDGEIKVINSYILTNFHLYGVTPDLIGKVYTPYTALNGQFATEQGIERYGQGLERYNILAEAVILDKEDMRNIMSQVKFSKAYTNSLGTNFWYSEFVGLSADGTVDIDVDTPADKQYFVDRINDYKTKWTNRDRNNPEVWHTTHMCIYDFEGNPSIEIRFQESDSAYIFQQDYRYNSQSVTRLDFDLTVNQLRVEANEKLQEAKTYASSIMPTKTSDLNNDSGFVASTTATAIWTGTLAQYNAIEEKDPYTIYLVKD